jgi:hypothetical protein
MMGKSRGRGTPVHYSAQRCSGMRSHSAAVQFWSAVPDGRAHDGMRKGENILASTKP